MKIYNLNNKYLDSQRYSWNNIILQLSLSHTNDNVGIVDYMDKYFNYYLDTEKIIEYKNNTFNVLIKETYYYNDDIKQEDVFICKDNFGFEYILKWYSEYNEFKPINYVLKHNLTKKYNIENITIPWIGIIHYPEFVEEMNFNSYESVNNIINTSHFIESIKYCKYIVVLTNHIVPYVKKYIPYIPIKVLYHPTITVSTKFNYSTYVNNNDKKILQIGFWMRKMDTIFNLSKEIYNTDITLLNKEQLKIRKYRKVWLPGGEYWNEMFHIIYNNATELLSDTSIEILLNLSNEDYDNLLTSNIVLLDIFNSSANNTLIECIVRNTPIICLRHPAIIEYLGEDYPLYFDKFEEIQSLVTNTNLHFNAHNYLKRLNKNFLNINTFIENIKKLFIT